MKNEAKGQEPKQATSAVKATDTARRVGPLRRAWYQRISEAHQRGEFVAWTMYGVADEILAAFGVLPVLAENYGPVCAAKQMASHFCQIAESDGYSKDLCSYLRTGLGIAKRQAELGEPPPEAPYCGMGKPDMVIGFSLVCNGRYKWLQEVARYLDVPCFIYDVRDFPGVRDRNDEAMKRRYVEHYYEQLKRLAAFLEETTGKKLNKNRLSQALDNWMKSSMLFRDACKLRKAHPNPLPAQDSATVCFPFLHFRAYPEAVDFYQQLYDEVKYRADNKIGSMPQEKYRLWWYLQLPFFYMGLFNWLEENFGATTLNNSWEPGELPSQGVVDLNYPLESIAKKMYEEFWQVNGMVRRVLGLQTVQNIGRFVKEYDIDALVSLMVSSCRNIQALNHTWMVMKESIDLPVLRLEADMVDERTYSDAVIKERLTAFLETVDAAKRKRRGGDN
ncbi:2-hydroxyacyl-CoA dehydratase subunit D [Chloroflexota bacterium]